MNVSINFGLYGQSQGRVRRRCLIQTGIEIMDLVFRVSSIILWIRRHAKGVVFMGRQENTACLYANRKKYKAAEQIHLDVQHVVC
ncbi:MAG TPA: hypothetical protein DEF35_15625 [Paenibacillus sp.]|uniref:hypothetical protein n=1 Tax=Paenibacillus sp. MAEPY1 TaxID=1395586 RepID=UPI000464D42D|nr:hypothetical protein [Paenibacillus sp. MAEPY1]KGP82488.1 hypothetical protein P364_0112380 [Paenibacillus sp. MAEPY2]KGP89220.1 hypothetical protein P363_0102605 [Paenibacillus sp. MAEPY1]OZQ71648.1 hypothetical protein CA599_09515 [Paenibacillus taichungensis]HBU83053.1 hypothetical protein [Paenibacillus sp.]